MKTLNDMFTSDRVVSESYKAGDSIYQPDNFHHCLGLIAEGCAIVERSGVRLNILSKGSIFGAATLFGSEDCYLTSVKAKSDCTVLFLSQEDVAEILRNDSELSLVYITFLSDKIRFLNKKIAAFTSGNAENKLAYYLAEHGGCGVSETVTYKELASALNIGRASLYRAIDSLSEKGVIEKDGKIIKILNINMKDGMEK